MRSPTLLKDFAMVHCTTTTTVFFLTWTRTLTLLAHDQFSEAEDGVAVDISWSKGPELSACFLTKAMPCHTSNQRFMWVPTNQNGGSTIDDMKGNGIKHVLSSTGVPGVGCVFFSPGLSTAPGLSTLGDSIPNCIAKRPQRCESCIHCLPQEYRRLGGSRC